MNDGVGGDSIQDLIPRDMRVMRRGLEQLVSRLLEPGESLLVLSHSSDARRWWQRQRPRHARVILVTDRRLVLVPFGLVSARGIAEEAQHPEPESLLRADIQRIDEEHGLVESRVNVVTAARTVCLRGMGAKAAWGVASAVRSHMGEGSRPDASAH